MVYTFNKSYSELVAEPVPLTKLQGRNSQKLFDRNLKCKYVFYRTGLALSEYNFNFDFCRVIVETFGFKIRLRYGAGTSSLKRLFAHLILKRQLLYEIKLEQKEEFYETTKCLQRRFGKRVCRNVLYYGILRVIFFLCFLFCFNLKSILKNNLNSN